MDSPIIETLGCPLDLDLVKSWERFTLESSHSLTSSDPYESADEETGDKHDALIQQFKNLSVDAISDSKYASSKCSNEITEINAQKKDISEDLIIFLESEEDEENQSSSFPLKDKELLRCVDEVDGKAAFSKLSRRNCESNSRKKNNIGKLIFVGNMKINENWVSSSPFGNNKILNNDYKSSSDASAEDESDSDDDELEESVILRERAPKRHNRPENNKQQRTTPFPQNHSKQQHLNSNNYQMSSNDGSVHLNQNNSTSFERYNRTFPTRFPNSVSVTGEAIGGTVSSIMSDQIVNGVIPCGLTDQIVNGVIPCRLTDQIVNGVIPCGLTDQIVNGVIPCDITDQIANGVIPCTGADQIANGVIPCAATDQIVNGVIPCAVTDQIVNGVNPYTVEDEVFDSVVPSAVEIGNMINRGCTVTNEERFLEYLFDSLTEEEVDNIITNSFKSKSGSFPCQNHVNVTEGNSVASTSKEISYPKSNNCNFRTESDGLHSFFPNMNAEETSFNSNLDKQNCILENSGELYGYENLAKKSGNYINMVSENFSSINRDCLSPEASKCNNVSEEIVQWEEIKEWLMKDQKNVSERPPPTTGISWDELPFDGLDPSVNTSHRKKASKSKRINHTRRSACKAEEPQILRIWGTAARNRLFHSASFSIKIWELEIEKMRHQIKNGELGTEQKKIIHFLKKNRKTKYKGTNLHYAIIAGNIEKVYCIVELHKECHGTTNEINLRDSSDKTVLDYSKEKGMDLLSDYLEENDAKEYSLCLITV